MAKEFARKFYNSKAWKQTRVSYISKADGLCEHCQCAGFILDHIEELTPDNINNLEITLNHDNLQYLCLTCHNKKTFGRDVDVVREGLMFDCNGDLVRRSDI